MSEEKNKGGRPTKFKEEYIEQAVRLAKIGTTNEKMAEFFQVNESTLYKWMNENETFSKAINESKVHSDDAIVNSLFNKALGYTLWEEKEEETQDGFKKVKVKKQVAGDTTAMIFWLKNRRPAEWREKQEVKVELNNDFESLLDDANK